MTPDAAAAPLAVTFAWQPAEHRRFVRRLQLEALRRGRARWIVWAVVAGFVLDVGWLVWRHHAAPFELVVVLAPFLALFAVWIALFWWGLPYTNARTYSRTHPCAHQEQIRVLSPDGLEIGCATQRSMVPWSAIIRALETPEFILFFASPSSAVHLPLRALPSADERRRARALLREALGERAELLEA